MKPGDIDWNVTQVVFLAMVWVDGEAVDLAGLVETYDWINHSIPSREELQGSLNVLLAMGLIEVTEKGCFAPLAAKRAAFEAFREKKRKDKFETVRMFFEDLDRPEDVAEVVVLEDSAYRACLKAYLGKFHSL